MTRLTDLEKDEHKAWLYEWREPKVMSQYTDNLMDKVGSSELFRQGGLSFIREAWLAARFAIDRQASYIRLIDDTWPDFEMKFPNNEVEKFEALEADEPERRRGDEYKNVKDNEPQIEEDPVEDWIARANLVPEIIRQACAKKMGKQYSSDTNLLIYLNIEEYGIRQNEIESCFDEACAQAKNHFLSIWILWKKKSYLVCSNEPNLDSRFRGNDEG